jgi:hypothetical protein
MISAFVPRCARLFAMQYVADHPETPALALYAPVDLIVGPRSVRRLGAEGTLRLKFVGGFFQFFLFSRCADIH